MNIFAVDNSPFAAAIALPDKHIVKMPLECSQMLAVCFGHTHGMGIGHLRKIDGTHYADTAFHHHPCTQWALSSFANMAWLIVHAQSLLFEYVHRYGKIHGCGIAISDAAHLFTQTGFGLGCYEHHTVFARAMPDEFKYDDTIGSIEAYRRYMRTKTWAAWKRDPSRKPTWWNS